MCEMHYYRQRRLEIGPKKLPHTPAAKKAPRPSRAKVLTHAGPYALAFDPDHPVARKSGMVLEHRRVLYGKIGPGPHPCHWCRCEVEWGASGRRQLIADHLDGRKRHNEPENLVPSCNPCNVSRGRFEAWLAERAQNDPDRLREILGQLGVL